MTRRAQASRTRRCAPGVDEAGFSLVELTFAMAIFAVALALLVPTFLVISGSTTSTRSMTADDTAILPALSTLEGEISSAGTASVTDSGFTLILYTTSLSGAASCAQWQVQKGPDGANMLSQRSWPPASTSAVAFTFVASGVNVANTTSQPPFVLTGNASNVVDINLLLAIQGQATAQELTVSQAALGKTTGICTPPPTS